MNRETLRLIKPAPAAVVERFDGESEWHFNARSAAIARLGTAWVKHPHYRYSARHSTDLQLWADARVPFLAEIARRAAESRERNPAFQKAQRVRAVVGAP